LRRRTEDKRRELSQPPHYFISRKARKDSKEKQHFIFDHIPPYTFNLSQITQRPQRELLVVVIKVIQKLFLSVHGHL